MPKTKISEYSATNSANTDIEGINIDEGCAPSGINNAIRELMVHLKEFQTGASGDAFTFAGGTLMSGTNTISGAAIISGNINSSGTNTFSGSNFMSFSGGSSASPSIYFASDTNTGIFSPAADTIAFTEGGAEAMRIDSSGNVGIGTTSPLLPLHVVTTGTGTAMGDNASATFRSGASGRASTIQLSDGTNSNYVSSLSGALGFGTGSTERMRIDSSGNVGIGTSSPVNLGAGYTSLTINNATNGGGIVFAQNGTQKGAIFNVANDVYFDVSNGAGNLYFRNTGDGTTNATIDSSGNVGIGTTSPNCRLQIEGTTDGIYSRVRNSAGTSARIAFESAGVASASIGIPSGTAALAFYLSSETTERARITSGGALLVGTTAFGNVNADAMAFSPSSKYMALSHASGTSSGSGYVSFGLSTSEIGSITQNGTTAVAYNTTSDYRLKENVQPMQNALAKVAQLKPVNYTWKVDGSAGQGFIAHELQAVCPDAVTGEKDATKIQNVEVSPAIPATYDEDGNELTPAVEAVYEQREVPKYQGVDTSFLVATLTAAIQELKAELDATKAEVAALKAGNGN